jgi:DNA-3-methyladenine glycosylase II
VIGYRISIKQTRKLRARIAAELGTSLIIGEESFAAFPTPAQILDATALPVLSQTKTERLHAIARAAQAGWLERDALRAMAPDAALAKLQTLPGIGPFFAQGILYRGAGAVDALSSDHVTPHAVMEAYGLQTPADRPALEQIAEAWRPYRMWTVVLLNVWARRELRLPSRRSA